MKLAYSAVLALTISFNVYTVVLILEVSIELEDPFIVEHELWTPSVPAIFSERN